MTDLQHNALGGVAAEMHGLVWQPKADAAARLLINVVQDDVDQAKLVLQSDTGELWYPVTTGVSATWRKVITDGDANYAGGVIRYYGDASDGDLLITSSDVNLTTEKNYNTISWGVGATGRLLPPATTAAPAFAVRCRTLDLTNVPVGGVQSSAAAAGNAVGAVGGAGGLTRFLGDGTVLGGSTPGIVGGVSTTTTGTAGTAGTNIAFGNGGPGSASGAGGAGSSGAGGVSRAAGTVTLGRRFKTPVTPEELVGGIASGTGSPRQIQGGSAGGSGGGGGGDGAASGAGGGAGGGGPVLAIYARTWIFAASTPASAIQCRGGDGGNGAGPGSGNKGGGSGGGAGGGGYIYALGDNFIGAGLAANTFDVSGGEGGDGQVGTGTGVNGGGAPGGSGGNVDIVQRGVGRIAQVTGTTGTAASGVTGGAGNVARVGV